ncbi:MAG: SOS response-associated peptidase, partial [Bacteroidia bacterium]
LNERFNISPGPPLKNPVLSKNPKKALAYMQWGINGKMSSIRADNLFKIPKHNELIHTSRCLVLASGFYEWKQMPGKVKQPYHFAFKDDRPFFMAGVWNIEKEIKTGKDVAYFSIITTAPNAVVAPVHDRMPVIIAPDHAAEYLNHFPEEQYMELLQPYKADEMHGFAVNPKVGNVRYDKPDCIEPFKEEQLDLFS